MAKLEKIKYRVLHLLQEYPETRSSDDKLFCNFCLIYYGISKISFFDAFSGSGGIKLPSYNSVSRARRSIQREHEELRATAAAEKIRDKEETEYKEYYSNEADKYRNIHP